MNAVEYERRVVAFLVDQKGCDLSSERAYRVEIRDEAAGEFVAVFDQSGSEVNAEIGIERSAWPVLRAAIDDLMAECREADA